MMSHCKNNFNDFLFPKHWKVLAFVISFSLMGAKTLESMGLLSSWCDGSVASFYGASLMPIPMKPQCVLIRTYPTTLHT